MERHTYFEGGKWRLRVGDTEYSGPLVDRLAAYEDTGLTPEEIEQLKGEAFGLRVDNGACPVLEYKDVPKDCEYWLWRGVAGGGRAGHQSCIFRRRRCTAATWVVG